MRSLHIALREFSAAFRRPIAYVTLSVFLMLCGAYTFILHPYFVISRTTLKPFFEFVPFLYTLFIPALTMGSVAEERRSRRIEALQTWPIGDAELIVGKFFGYFALVALALALTLTFPLSVAYMGPLDWGEVIGGYLGLSLLGMSFTSIGVFSSSLTQNQIIAFILGFVLCFILYIVGHAAIYLPAPLSEGAHFLSIQERMKNVSNGVISARDLVYFLSLCMLALGLASERMHGRQWR